MVKLIYGLHKGSPKVVELEVGLYYGCSSGYHRSLGSNNRSSRMVNLVMGLHYGNPKVDRARVWASSRMLC